MARTSGRGIVAAAAAAILLGLALVAGGSTAGARGSGLTLSRIGGFDAPVYVDDAPGAPKLLFVVEQPGTIRVLRDGKTLKRDFLDIRKRVLYGGEQGLLSVAFAPGYAHNRRFYVYYVNRAGNIEVDGFRRSRGNATKAKAASREKVIVIRHPVNENHNGGQLQFGPDGDLYLATGDGGGAGDPSGNAQDPGVLLGKLLRIDPRKQGGYGVPRSNPFVHRHGKDEIYALGLRNPYRFSFDSRNGDIYIGDVGQENWEEIDTAGAGGLAGSNFGWDIFEGDHPYDGGGTPANYRPPAVEYSSGGDTPNCAVTGGYVVRDPSLPALQGRYLYADFCGGSIRSFDPSNPGPSDSATGLELGLPSSFGEGAKGRIYVASLDGAVYRIAQG
jgi:glucose/arabinose dehydrogenase